ncbi:hypothetical protein LZZ85_26865 [Terrimonas sp. NA20]|uniref:Aromatic hydrocarbon degradation protein n=1 Tax=Terrimonas ginsenosidimutans TaxID=2908004 RepID=A0ABS9L0C0_9BACT|nr:hypothetical protein [Terrimonas ginsenosidimutans]MCG2617953.1 hypothetical protein [Terrimonas ginsenosidimutans]
MFRFSISVLLTTAVLPAFSQDNSPYSRYGIGDLTPGANINSRGMGGISAAIFDAPAPLSINYSNPASYAFFQSRKESKSNKLAAGRAILDVGINLDNRNLIEPNNTNKFGTSNLLFSHVQLGVPLRQNWGLSFGIRPVSRVSYQIASTERLVDPNTGQSIDTAGTLYQGSGGAFLPNLGMGYKFNFGKNDQLAIGAGVGYLFGSKDISSRRFFLNDTVSYNAGNFQTKTTYGNIMFNGGLQYTHAFNKGYALTLGAFGNMRRKLNASQDVIRETYYYDENLGNTRIDSSYETKDIKGDIIYPSSFTVGFALRRNFDFEQKKGDWLVGVDLVRSNWDEYRVYGAADPTVKSNWQVRVGGQLRPFPAANYFSNVAYRAGFFVGPDYVQVESRKLNTWGASLGFGLPLSNFSRTTAPNQITVINLALEYSRRGDNQSALKESLFRVSIGLSLSDLWFMKRKYD